MKVTIWNEEASKNQKKSVLKLYPQGLQGEIQSIFAGLDDIESRISTLDDPEDGLSDSLLQDTDVLIYWGHTRHDELDDKSVERIIKRVNQGMGVIFLHSAHFSKPFKALMGRSGALRWREDGKHERIWNVNPSHPIAYGIPENFKLKKEEMYGETFDIPTPDDLIFIGWFPEGEVFRSGFTYHYGQGRIFYFQPGHETDPSFKNKYVRKIIENAVYWTSPVKSEKQNRSRDYDQSQCRHSLPLEGPVARIKRHLSRNRPMDTSDFDV